MGDIVDALLGYKIFDTLQDFYDWQGYNGSPSDNTVNYRLGFTDYNVTKRYTYPTPHPTVS